MSTKFRDSVKLTRDFGRHPGTWLPPLLVLLVLSIALPAVYLGGTLNPDGNLRDLPIALVVESQTSTDIDAAEHVRTAVTDGVDAQAIDLIAMSADEEREQMSAGKIFGAIRIPADFNTSITRLATAAPGPATHAVVHLDTNPAAATMSTGLFTGHIAPVLAQVNAGLAATLPQTAAATTAPAASFTVTTAPLTPLPSHTGLGTSVFYYAVVLVLLGFVGASVIHPIVDSASGFQPSELGPIVQRRDYTPLSRRQLLAVKWCVALLAAPLGAGLIQLIATLAFHMPAPAPWQLYLFSTATIAAVNVGALTVFAIFGSLGPLVNMFFFVAMAMTSSAGTLPVEATPPFFQAIATFEPMRPIVTGLRSILYYDSTTQSGLHTAWIRLAIGGLIGITLGLVTTSIYDRNPAFTRHPSP
ncbi:YhgE/Pip domain-containing protein [Nocardia abscessus]|uniref:YhgE/Pip domain-containing protein n=1 Tax=Nocardia abscessus TaxID=120957 RepID=UPI0002FECA12|nr:ABC transporter permease [Nocardia abscessus]MCC3330983.1 SNG1 family protein [Nocardia abscessus]